MDEKQSILTELSPSGINEAMEYLKTQFKVLTSEINIQKIIRLATTLEENVATLQRIEEVLEKIYTSMPKEEKFEDG